MSSIKSVVKNALESERVARYRERATKAYASAKDKASEAYGRAKIQARKASAALEKRYDELYECPPSLSNIGAPGCGGQRFVIILFLVSFLIYVFAPEYEITGILLKAAFTILIAYYVYNWGRKNCNKVVVV